MKKSFLLIALMLVRFAVFAQKVASLPKDRETITVNGVSFNMIKVKGGTFTMGCTDEQGGDCYSDEKPAHKVTLDDYYIGETEVTQALWKAVMGSDYDSDNRQGDNLPVEGGESEWEDFIRKLNQMTDRNFRLPTEAEWEYAARGGNKSRGYKYAGSNNKNDVAWHYGNSAWETHQVKTKQPNELGLYDMSGNVQEWCQDWYGKYSSNPQTNPKGSSTGSRRVLRGGYWADGERQCRVSSRDDYNPDEGYHYGLRLVLTQ